jgi:hypothetical protein
LEKVISSLGVAILAEEVGLLREEAAGGRRGRSELSSDLD